MMIPFNFPLSVLKQYNDVARKKPGVSQTKLFTTRGRVGLALQKIECTTLSLKC